MAHPRPPIVFWPAAGVMIALVSRLSTYTSSNRRSFVPNSFESVKARNVGNKHFPAQSEAMRSLVFSRNDAGKLTSDDQQKVKGLVSTLNDDKLYSNGKVMVAL